MNYGEAYEQMRQTVELACQTLAKHGHESDEFKKADEKAFAAIVKWNKIRLGIDPDAQQ